SRMQIPVDSLLASSTALLILQRGTALCLVLAAAGFLTRFNLIVSSAGCTFIGGIIRAYGYFNHDFVIPIYILYVLCFLPIGPYCLDRVFRGNPKGFDADDRSDRYQWAVYLCFLALVLPYLSAGYCKFRHLCL